MCCQHAVLHTVYNDSPPKSVFLGSCSGSSWEPGCDFGRKTRATGDAKKTMCPPEFGSLDRERNAEWANKIPEKAF
eukprot:854653-Amphidinium_carterae.2